MKKIDKNIIIFIILGIIAVLMWTFIQYSSTQKKAEERDHLIQEENEEKENEKERNQAKDTSQDEKIIPTISAADLNRKMNVEDITIIDMRTRTLYDNGHIRGSISIEDVDLTQLERSVVLATNNGLEDPIINYYRDLASTKTVYNLTGGIAQWQKEGHVLLSITNAPSFATAGKVQFVEPRALDATMTDPAQKEDLLIIDTRRPGNYEESHIENAVNIPLTEIERRYKEIFHTKNIYIYGADEETSFRAGILLHDLRFLNAKTIKGGFAAWKEYDYPVTK